jgi:predicted transcriptional regulator
MTLRDIRASLDAAILVEANDGSRGLERELPSVIGSDSMSDVLSFSDSGCLLLTGLTNAQTARTAEMADIAAICFVHGKAPAEGAIRLAREKGIVLLSTALGMYDACGRLYAAGMKGCKGKG